MKIKQGILVSLKNRSRTKRQLSIESRYNFPASAFWELEEQGYIESDSKVINLKTKKHIVVKYSLTNKGRKAVGLKALIEVRREEEVFALSYL